MNGCLRRFATTPINIGRNLAPLPSEDARGCAPVETVWAAWLLGTEYIPTDPNGFWTVNGSVHCPDGKGAESPFCVGGAAHVKLSKADWLDSKDDSLQVAAHFVQLAVAKSQ